MFIFTYLNLKLVKLALVAFSSFLHHNLCIFLFFSFLFHSAALGTKVDLGGSFIKSPQASSLSQALFHHWKSNSKSFKVQNLQRSHPWSYSLLARLTRGHFHTPSWVISLFFVSFQFNRSKFMTDPQFASQFPSSFSVANTTYIHILHQ